MSHLKRELMKLLQLHVEHGALKKEEGDVVAGALAFRSKPLKDIMTKKEHCFFLPCTAKLDYTTIVEIAQSGFSRIPICGKNDNDIIGVLVTKDLIFVDPEDAMPLEEFLKVFGRKVEVFFQEDTCGDALQRFKGGAAHMGLVRRVNVEDVNQDPFYELIGIVTLEDVIEEILQDEIVDETDVYVDVDAHRLRDHKTTGCGGRSPTKINSKEQGVSVQHHHHLGGTGKFHGVFSKLRFFNPQIRTVGLLAEEVHVLVAHLLENYQGSGGQK